MAFQTFFRRNYIQQRGRHPISLFPQKLPDQVPRAAACLSFDLRQIQLL